LSSPRLTTLNNQTAVLRSATADVFFVTETERTPGPSGVQSFTTVTPRTVTVGVVLSITPQISSDGSVILHVRPTVSRSDRTASITVDNTTISVPILDVREADVIVRAEEGQVVVIGGGSWSLEVVILGSLGGIPVVNVPVGFDPRGRPMGMQVMGRFGEDQEVLEFSMAYERVTDHLDRRPELVEGI
ncbi:MAG: hypothetical protein IH921_12160, partial [Gemmatimonadetes bacterium]|nr:hypothetical protein [Gemmatimonadota bacterium]